MSCLSASIRQRSELRRSMARSLVMLILVAGLTGTLLAQKGQEKPREALGAGVQAADRITREVRHELLMLPYYTLFDDLAYTVDGNKVTLLGKVTNPTLKSDAESVVKKVEGVETVDNKIEVLPPSPNDDRIRRAVYRAIYGSDGLSRYGWGTLPSIHIIVDRGNVTLAGTVDSEADKNLAGLQANGVPGVFSVKNDLMVAKSK